MFFLQGFPVFQTTFRMFEKVLFVVWDWGRERNVFLVVARRQ